MIEYILLFSLGFLTAALAALLVAPAVRRRIVHFTEKRIKATVPLSVAELQAGVDMARATYAAENAKLSQSVRRERDKGVASELKAERLLGELKEERSEAAGLREQLQTLAGALDVMSGRLEASQAELTTVRLQLRDKEDALQERDATIAELNIQIHHLGGLIDSEKIDLAVRDTELENLKSLLAVLKGERDRLRDDVREAEERARHAEIRLEHDEGKIVNLQERLDRELAANAGLGVAKGDAPDDTEKTGAQLMAQGSSERALPNGDGAPAETPQERVINVIDQQLLTEGIRRDANAVFDKLDGAANPADDERMREEIASIAARMVALTAAREGASSPLVSLFDEKARETERASGRLSLAERASRVLSGKDN